MAGNHLKVSLEDHVLNKFNINTLQNLGLWQDVEDQEDSAAGTEYPEAV